MLQDLFHTNEDDAVAASSGGQPPQTVRSFSHHMKTRPVEIKLTLLNQHHSLWANCLWNASVAIADLLETTFLPHCSGKRVLELGCGAGLPSLVAHQLDAKEVLLTEYPEETLLKIVNQNISINIKKGSSHIKASGLRWGDRQEISKIRAAYPDGFDLIILSDLIFNHSQHIPLLATASALLNKNSRDAMLLVAFSHHRPHKISEDLNFFHLAAHGRAPEEAGHNDTFPGLSFPPFIVVKTDTIVMQPMFEHDKGDPVIRSQVHVYTLKHAQ
ncbi:Protein N-terminal and lysine N-methyltransferase efm7 [Mitosporidium daphniae]|uniref:Nicotinamide N-methyltransferase n=1 Tax=Mitosporidium daphniae TaxID=1485682 RepID=A0A098VV53_9MICR|nr:uncharacterized protein DI09_11p280 [Mitosporidium daphniae]KGG52983.1 hypothetical protein DI09_11p280 [Mitosporidium daphniae]|eukprot:XP_013239410.1 uncharacterized protein DI09_11p280 [Mitosporidium daphniae]